MMVRLVLLLLCLWPITAQAVLLTDFTVRTEPALPTMGAAGSKVTDPTFGTEILRLTDATSDPAGAGTLYSTYASVNSDSTRVMGRKVSNSNSIFWTLDATAFTVASRTLITGDTISMLQYYMLWSTTNPDLLYATAHPAVGSDAAKLFSYNIATQTQTTLKDFSGLTLAGIAAHSGAWLDQMSASSDGDVFSFTVLNASQVPQGYLVYKLSTNAVLLNTTDTSVNETYVDKSGRYFYELIGTSNEVKVWDLQTGPSLVADLTTNGFGHNGPGTGTVYAGSNASGMSSRSLATPNTVTHILDGYFGTGTNSHHISYNSTNETYGLVSRYSVTGGGVINAFDNELLLVSASTDAVQRIAHHRSISNTYAASPFANISPDGQFVAFTSTWGTNLAIGGRTDLYLVKIPAVGGGAPTPILTQAVFEWHGLRGTEAAPEIQPYAAAPENSSIAVVAGGKSRVRINLVCTVANCPSPVSFVPRYSKNGGAYTVIPDSFSTDNIALCGSASLAEVPASGSATTSQLTGAQTFVAGQFVRAGADIATTTLAQDRRTEHEFCLTWDTDAAAGDTYDVRLYQQDGTVLDVYTATPRATILPMSAGAGF